MRELIPRAPTALSRFGEEWPLERMHREIERTFDRWMRDIDRGLEEFWMPSLTTEAGPVAELEEDENEVLITAEMPGLEKEDFKVELLGDRLTIRGEKKAERKEHKRGYRFAEARYGAFRRTFLLPCAVKADEIKAEFKNGELRCASRLSYSERFHNSAQSSLRRASSKANKHPSPAWLQN